MFNPVNENSQMLRDIPVGIAGSLLPGISEIDHLVTATAAYLTRLLGLDEALAFEISLGLGSGAEKNKSIKKQALEIGPVKLAMPFAISSELIGSQLTLLDHEGIEISKVGALDWLNLECRWIRSHQENDWVNFKFLNCGHGSSVHFQAFEEQANIKIELSRSLQEVFKAAWLEESFNNFLVGSQNNPQALILDLPFLGDGEEREQILNHFSQAEQSQEILGATSAMPTLTEIFKSTVAQFPERPAIECGSESISYHELNIKSDVVARQLIKMGVRPGVLVGLFMRRSCDAFVAMLGILKAGGAYVPMDPDYPADRVEYILKDSLATVLLSHRSLLDTLGEKLGTLDCKALAFDDLIWEQNSGSEETLAVNSAGKTDLAYVIYTSGTTGRPKGVMIEHRSICHLIFAEMRVFAPTSADRIYQGFSLAFDASLEEIWLAFASGATLVAATADEAFAAAELCALLNAKKVSIFSTVPTILAIMEGDLDTVHTLILGGEAAPKSLVEKWKTKNRRVINTYGPTETTVVSTYSDCVAGERVTIGKGLANLKTYVLGDNLEILPVGSAGELFLGGPCLARGYLGQEDLTAAKFVKNPYAKNADQDFRLYRTGDLVRFTVKGELEFLGRKDAQVKLRGYRIELSEIESVLLECPHVVASAACLSSSSLGIEQLVAFVVPESGSVLNLPEIQTALRARLASYMMPSHIEIIAELPKLPSGKLDRKKLSSLIDSKQSLADAEVWNLPRISFIDSDVQYVYEIWQKIFSPLPVTGVEDDFFDLGGHSLLAAKMVSMIRKEIGCGRLSVVDVYRYPKLGQLAKRLREIKNQDSIRLEAVVAEQSDFRVVSPLKKVFCVLGQAVGLLALSAVTMIPLLALLSYSFHQYAQGESLFRIAFQGSFISLLFIPAFAALAIISKWVFIGKYKAGSYPVWGGYYLRFWLVTKIEALVPVGVFHGTFFLNLYYRLMGAKIGKNVFIGTQYLRIYDLIEIGDDSTVEYEAQLLGYTLQNGRLVIGAIKLGEGSHVGTKATMCPSSKIEEGGELAAMSLLLTGQSIPPKACWTGSPAQPLKMNPAKEQSPMPSVGALQKILLAIGQLAVIVALPFLFIVPEVFIFKFFLQLTHELSALAMALLSPLAAAVGILEFCLEVALLKWILIGKIQASRFKIHSFYYLRKWTVESLMQTHLKLCYSLYATLYLIPWFRLMGARIGKRVEISTAAHISSDLLVIDDESFIADSACLGAPRVRRGWMEIAETKIGRRTFVGNSAMIPDGTQLGSKCLVGVLSTPPILQEESILEGSSWLGSPAIRLPRRQETQQFAEVSTYSPSRGLYLQRLFVEFFRVSMPATLTLGVLYATFKIFLAFQQILSSLVLWTVMPLVGLLIIVTAVGIVIAAKWILIGTYKPGDHPLWSSFVWRNELVTALHEAFAVPVLVNTLQGTPFIAIYFRLLGSKIGKSAIIDTTHFTEFDLIHIGDQVCLNSHATVQTHLFEDRVFKQSTLWIGDACSVGPMSVVLMDSKMGRGSQLEGLSLLMKGESLPDKTRWAGVPIHAVQT